jgi:hypothetical protein
LVTYGGKVTLTTTSGRVIGTGVADLASTDPAEAPGFAWKGDVQLTEIVDSVAVGANTILGEGYRLTLEGQIGRPRLATTVRHQYRSAKYGVAGMDSLPGLPAPDNP